MSSFSLEFPDKCLLAVLGDDITHIKPGGGSEELRGIFEWKFLEQALGDLVDIKYPTIELDDKDAKDVKSRKSRMKFNGDTFEVYKKVPNDIGKTLVVMRLV